MKRKFSISKAIEKFTGRNQENIYLPDSKDLPDLKSLIRVCVIGNKEIGKSTFLNAIQGENKNETFVKNITLNNVETTLTLHEVDYIVDSRRTNTFGIDSNPRSDAFIVPFDLTDKESFKDCLAIIRTIERYGKKDAVIVLVGNKSDLKDQITVTDEKVGETYPHHPCIKISAKTGDKVQDVLTEVASKVYAQQLEEYRQNNRAPQAQH